MPVRLYSFSQTHGQFSYPLWIPRDKPSRGFQFSVFIFVTQNKIFDVSVLVRLVSADQKVFILHDFDFDPIARSLPYMVFPVLSFGDDSFQPLPFRECKKSFPFPSTHRDTLRFSPSLTVSDRIFFRSSCVLSVIVFLPTYKISYATNWTGFRFAAIPIRKLSVIRLRFAGRKNQACRP